MRAAEEHLGMLDIMWKERWDAAGCEGGKEVEGGKGYCRRPVAIRGRVFIVSTACYHEAEA